MSKEESSSQVQPRFEFYEIHEEKKREKINKVLEEAAEVADKEGNKAGAAFFSGILKSLRSVYTQLTAPSTEQQEWLELSESESERPFVDPLVNIPIPRSPTAQFWITNNQVGKHL